MKGYQYRGMQIFQIHFTQPYTGAPRFCRQNEIKEISKKLASCGGIAVGGTDNIYTPIVRVARDILRALPFHDPRVTTRLGDWLTRGARVEFN